MPDPATVLGVAQTGLLAVIAYRQGSLEEAVTNAADKAGRAIQMARDNRERIEGVDA